MNVFEERILSLVSEKEEGDEIAEIQSQLKEIFKRQNHQRI